MSTEEKIAVIEEMISDGQYYARIHGDHGTTELDKQQHAKHVKCIKVLLEAREAVATIDSVKGVLPL